MKTYANSQGYSVWFEPWCSSGFRLIDATFEEVLGGDLAGGTVNLVGSSQRGTQQTREEEYTGKFTIEKNGNLIKTFDVFIVSKSFKKERLSMSFVCVTDPKYYRDADIITYSGSLDNIVKQIYPNVDIRCASDIQGEDLHLYQNYETNLVFLNKIAAGFRKNSVFGHTLEKFIIKETCTKEEMDSALLVASHPDSQTPGNKPYTKSLYYSPTNLWTDGKDDRRVGKDYSKVQSRYIRSISHMGDISYMERDTAQLLENVEKNIVNLGSSYFQRLNFSLKDIPPYGLGDVVEYFRTDISASGIEWPYRYYLVYSTYLYFSTSGTGKIDPRSRKPSDFSYLTTLVGLEEDGKIALAKTEEEDPTLEEQKKEPTYFR